MMRVRNNRKKGGQAGFVQTTELLLISTVLGLGLLTGLSKLRDQTVAELADTGSAIGSINQSITIAGTDWSGSTATTKVASVAGFTFIDAPDTGTDPSTAGAVGGDGLNIDYRALPASGVEVP